MTQPQITQETARELLEVLELTKKHIYLMVNAKKRKDSDIIGARALHDVKLAIAKAKGE